MNNPDELTLVNYDFWNAIPMPAVYRIEFRG